MSTNSITRAKGVDTLTSWQVTVKMEARVGIEPAYTELQSAA